MDTSESYSRGGYRGGGRGGGTWQQNDYQRGYDSGPRGGYRGGRGGAPYYSERGPPRDYHGGPPPPPPRDYYQGPGWQQPPPREYNDFYHGGGRRGGGGRGRSRQDWGRGNRNYKWERDRIEKEEVLPADVVPLTELVGHSQKVTAILYEASTQQVYTGSADGTVKAWSAVNGTVVSTVDVGGEVDSLLIAGGYLFVGLHKAGEGIIKVWNMATGANHLLTGHKGAVLALAIANTSLVSAGQDFTIRVWNFNQQAEIFMSQAIITKDEGGHTSAVHALCVVGNFMFSADRQGQIVVWDLATGKPVQRIADAHPNSPIMQLLPFENFLLSAGMDGLIRCWQVKEQALPGMVLESKPEYVWDKENPDVTDGSSSGSSQALGPGRQRRGRVPPGIVTMSGTIDKSGTPILMVAYNGESCVRLYQLPEFNDRGVLVPAMDTRSLGSVAGTAMLTGDNTGRVRIFQWKL